MDCFGSDVGSSVDGSLSFSDFDSVDSDVDFGCNSDEGSRGGAGMEHLG